MKGRLDIAFTSLPLPEAAAGDSPLTRDPTRRAYAQARAESGSRNTGKNDQKTNNQNSINVFFVLHAKIGLQSMPARD